MGRRSIWAGVREKIVAGWTLRDIAIARWLVASNAVCTDLFLDPRHCAFHVKADRRSASMDAEPVGAIDALRMGAARLAL